MTALPPSPPLTGPPGAGPPLTGPPLTGPPGAGPARVDPAGASEFRVFPADRRSEVSRTLAEPVPRALSLLDQLGLWGNFGVSLLGFTGAIFVLQPLGGGALIGFVPAGWMSASILSFGAAAVATLGCGALARFRCRAAAPPAAT